jgi:hypothetical protein
VTVRATDNGSPPLSDSKSLTITVNEVNQAPVLAAIANQSVAVGQTLTFTASGTDADIPANTLTYSLTGAPTGATINASTGAFSWTPASGQEGSYSFGVRVTDNGTPALSASQTVNVTVTTVPPGWWNTAWTKRKKLVFDRATRATDLLDFPLLVVLDATRIDYASTKAGGADLRFIDADGTTVLSHEIERWTSGGQSFVWVKVPKVDKSSTTDFIWMYYGNPAAADGQSVAAVWSGGHRAVWHLGATAVTDSTGFGHTGTDVGSVVASTAKVGGGRQFNGTSARVTVANAADISFTATASFTVTAWAQLPAVPATWTGIVTKSRGTAPWYGAWIDTAGQWVAGGPTNLTGGGAATGWSHVAMVQDGAAGTRRLYVNGVLAVSGAAQAANGAGQLWMGGAESVTEFFAGVLDEVRISNVARSADWVAAEVTVGNDSLVSFVNQ